MTCFLRQLFKRKQRLENVRKEINKEVIKQVNNDDKVIYISVNNWFCGRDYPDTPNFRKWMGDDLNQNFQSDKWCKENKLCVYHGVWDMSSNYTISAPREWVLENCPELLTDNEYTYTSKIGKPKEMKDGKFEYEWVTEAHTKKYSDFVHRPDPEYPDETPDPDYFGMPFRDYCEENFGSEYYETGYWDSDCEDEDEDDEDNDEEEDNE